VVHSQYDRSLVSSTYGLETERITVIPHASYTHYRRGVVLRTAPTDAFNLLFFGLIRPVKGLGDLLDAFCELDEDEVEQYWLTVVGETWEGCEDLVARARSCKYHHRIFVVNHYVSDQELDGYFNGADALILPYRQSSQSGVLHVAKAYGLPILATKVGGMPEALAGYEGAELVDAGSVGALVDGLRRLSNRSVSTTAASHGWEDSANQYRNLLETLETDSSSDRDTDTDLIDLTLVPAAAAS
jgi:glycosyltransferase involved in cell wall biosynthesis